MGTMVIKDRSFLAIIPFVLALHFFAVIWLINFSTLRVERQEPKKMVVSTIKLAPKPLSTSKIPAPPIEKAMPKEEIAQVDPVQEEKPLPPEKKKEEMTTFKKEEAPPAPPKKELEKPKPPIKKVEPKKKVIKKEPIKEPSAKKIDPPKKTEPKKITPKKETPISKPKDPPSPPKPNPAQEKLKQKQLELFSKAKEKISHIDTKSAKVSASSSSLLSTATPARIESLQVDSLWIDSSTTLNAKEIAYRDELAGRLKLLLKLPEYGDVKVKLTLDRQGKIVSLKIISSKSEANKNYIEKTLPQLKMPPFGTNFGDASEYTFTITMSNE